MISLAEPWLGIRMEMSEMSVQLTGLLFCLEPAPRSPMRPAERDRPPHQLSLGDVGREGDWVY